MKRVAFIGSAGVPNRYGGFESFLDACAPVMAERREVIVTCDAARYEDRAPRWNGVERLFIRVGANGASSILHDVLAFFAVYRRTDAIIVLGVSAGLFMPLIRVLCLLRRVRLIVNVDGVEWRRDKFSWPKKAYLWLSDRLSQLAADAVVVDSRPLSKYLSERGRKKARFIAYPGDQVLRLPAKPTEPYCLTICRIEPENNCEMLIKGFIESGLKSYKFVGNWRASRYGLDLMERYAPSPGIEMIEAIYNPTLVADLREHAAAYLHGHSVGGTNPSLVEMLFYDTPILAFDCPFNRETAGNGAHYFDTATSLARELQNLETDLRGDRDAARARYTRVAIVRAYEQILDG